MKINGLERYQSMVAPVKNGEGASAKGKVAKTDGSNTDKVTISGDAAVRAELRRVAGSLAAEVDSVSSERLAQLGEAVQNGSYRVAAEDIADAMLDLKV